MGKITGLLDEWQGKGLISPEQKAALQEYENSKVRHSWAMYGVAGVGVVVLIAGVVSIIAANWDRFSESSKILAYFLAQGALGFGIWKQREKYGLFREVLITLFGLFFLGGIGLIGQTYHLESDGYSAIFFWLGLILPITLLVRSRLLPHLRILGLGTGTLLWIFSAESRSNETEFEPYYRIMTGFAVAFFTLAVGLARRSILNKFFQSAALVWGVVVIVCIGATVGGVIVGSSFFNARHVPTISAWPWVGALTALASLHFFSHKTDRLGWKVCMGALILFSCVLITVPIHPSTPISAQLISLGSIVLLWGLAAAASAFADRKRLFDFCTFVVSARFVIAYFEVFGSLAATGIGLIISGCVILGAVWVWATMRNRLLKLAGGGVK